jgi:hypothetical protein
MTPSIVRKVLLARRLWDLSRRQLETTSELALIVGANLLQDAVEAFLLGVSEHVNAGIVEKTNFHQYFELINEKISPKELPFRSRLISLNRLRVNAKHAALVPARSEIAGLPILVREFFEEVTEQIFARKFATISLIDLVKDGETRTFLEEAEAAFAADDYERCLIACRKAVFVEFEAGYDVAMFENEGGTANFLARMASRAPHYARSPEYIKEHVLEPTDYIVLDHNRVEIQLMQKGIDSVTFWNVWRYTPAVYRRGKEQWFVKREFDKLEANGIDERAEYVLDATIEILLADQQSADETRSISHTTTYEVTLVKEQVPVYRKARTDSEVSYTPPGMTKLRVVYEVLGLDGVTEFWRVRHYTDEGEVVGFLPKSLTV